MIKATALSIKLQIKPSAVTESFPTKISAVSYLIIHLVGKNDVGGLVSLIPCPSSLN